MRGLFVTGTDTGVGKTILSAALLATMAADGERVSAYKPVITGLDEPPWGGGEAVWPADDVLLAAAAGMSSRQVAPLRYGPAVSPHLAAELAGERIDPARLLAGARAAAGERTLIVEGVGGLLTPLCAAHTVRDFAVGLRLPMLIAARPGLGTISHTLLTLEAARAAGLEVCAVVLTPWPDQPARFERSNRETIARLGSVEVEVLGLVRGPDCGDLARAGARLPWRRWLTEPASPPARRRRRPPSRVPSRPPR